MAQSIATYKLREQKARQQMLAAECSSASPCCKTASYLKMATVHQQGAIRAMHRSSQCEAATTAGLSLGKFVMGLPVNRVVPVVHQEAAINH